MVMPIGVCYGPYHQKDKPWSSYTSADINGDMIIIAKYFNHIRTYSMQDAGKYIVGAASNHKIRVSLESGFTKATGIELNRKSILPLAKRLVSPAQSHTWSLVTKSTAKSKITVQMK
jgi:hypothetical protein